MGAINTKKEQEKSACHFVIHPFLLSLILRHSHVSLCHHFLGGEGLCRRNILPLNLYYKVVSHENFFFNGALLWMHSNPQRKYSIILSIIV